jgi:hypothetical protein
MQQFAYAPSTLEDEMPEQDGHIVGYAKLIERYNLPNSLDRTSIISPRHRRYDTDDWSVFTPRYEPEDSIVGHLTFALKHEGVKLNILKELFAIINPELIARWIRLEPTGRYSRSAWFLYENLTGKKLDVPDVIMGNYVYLVDQADKAASERAIPSKRHRVNNNLPQNKTSKVSAVNHLEYSDLISAIKHHFDVGNEEMDTILHYLSKKLKHAKRP